MNNFRKTFRYVRPYRWRIVTGIFTAVGVSLLFTVSIGMLAPILQVMTSREGLAGWVNRSNVEDRLKIRLPQPGDPTLGEAAAVPNVLKVDKKSPALPAGLKPMDRIVGIDGKDAGDLLDATSRLAAMPGGHALSLTVERIDPATRQPTRAEIRLAMPASSIKQRALERLTRWLPSGSSISDRMWAMTYIMLILMVMTVVRNALRYVNDLLIEGSMIQVVMDMRSDVYHRLTSLPVSFFARNGVNDAISRVVQDTGQINVGLTTLFGKTIQEPTKAVFCLALALYLQPQVVLVAMLGAPISYLVVRKFGKKMRKAAKRALVSQSRMLAMLEETLFGLRVVKAYTMEGYERRRFFRTLRTLLGEQMRMRRIDSGVSPILEIVGFFGLMAAILLSTYFVLRGPLDLTLLITQLGLLIAMGDSMRKLSNVNNRLQHADAASERMLNLLQAEPERAGRDLPRVGPLADSIVFEDISFRYPAGETDVLRGLSLTARAGQIIAVVGPNGSGKTTLLSLLPRFFDPAGGRILWDGQDIGGVNLRSLRQQIGLVTQDAVLFADTVDANIRYGNQRIGREQVVQASRQAFADEFIQQMPDGYDSVIGEHGTTLSGGQKQRIALARAILRNPSVLILDEAMSQVDAESEGKIQQVLDSFLVGRTAFVIAHRFSTVRQANQIVVMDGGRIVGLGQHDALMESCPLYRTLYVTQFRSGEAPDSVAAAPAE